MVPGGRPADRASTPAGPVTLVVVNARVWTGAARRPWADAVVVRGDRLALVGGSAEARKLAAAPGARLIDARGAMLVAAEVLRAYTAAGAWAGVAERDGGVLAAGQPADFALVDRDLTRALPGEGRDAHVLLAVAGGRVVHEAPATP